MAATDADKYIHHEPSYQSFDNTAYVLPNDAPEHERLEEQARHLSAIMNHQVVHAPLDPSAAGLRLLDVGCGTGIVTSYLASRFANAQVYGLDLSPVPTLHRGPPNVHFLQGNVVSQKPSEWSRGPGAENDGDGLGRNEALFDLIFSRLLVCGMTDWPQFIRTELALLKPGGYAELHDVDWVWYDISGAVISDSWPWWRKLRAAGEAKGLRYNCASHIQQWMKDAGFEDVQVHKYRWPFGGAWEQTPEMREFGDYGSRAMQVMCWHAIPKTMEGSGCSPDEIEIMRQEMWRDLEPEEGKHWIFYVTLGRRPAEASH